MVLFWKKWVTKMLSPYEAAVRHNSCFESKRNTAKLSELFSGVTHNSRFNRNRSSNFECKYLDQLTDATSSLYVRFIYFLQDNDTYLWRLILHSPNNVIEMKEKVFMDKITNNNNNVILILIINICLLNFIKNVVTTTHMYMDTWWPVLWYIQHCVHVVQA